MADLTITAAQVNLVSGETGVLTAGEAVSAGEVLYKKAADGKAWLAISSASASAAAIGIALCDAAAEQQVVHAKAGAIVDLGAAAAAAAGEGYAVSDTAGGLQLDADLVESEFVTRVCEGLGDDNVRVTLTRTGIQHAAVV